VTTDGVARALAECFCGGGLHKQVLCQVYLPFKIKTFNSVLQQQLQAYTPDIKQQNVILGTYMRFSPTFAVTGKLSTTDITGNLRTLYAAETWTRMPGYLRVFI